MHQATNRVISFLQLAGVILIAASCSQPVVVFPTDEEVLREDVHDAFFVMESELFTADPTKMLLGRDRESLEFMIDGSVVTADLELVSNRSLNYRLLAQQPDGSMEELPAGDIRTYRGTLRENNDVIVAASTLSDGLHATVYTPSGDNWHMAPVKSRLGDLGDDLYVGYWASNSTVSTEERTDIELRVPDALATEGGSTLNATAAIVGLAEAEVAIDADYDFFIRYGTADEVAARAEAILNGINVQYERDVSITHRISGMVVRTAEADPYTATGASSLLSQLLAEWGSNPALVAMNRDIVHMLTGREIDGGTIGIAYIAAVCSKSAGFGLSQADFTNVFSNTTDLVAHEIGHNWSAGHCDCVNPPYTMNPFLTGANAFHPTLSVPSITAHRDSRTCLSSVTNPGDTTVPTIAITSPINNPVVSGVITLSANASDNVGVARVEFRVDGVLRANDASAPYSTPFDTTSLAAGSHTVLATAFDAAGNSASSSAMFSISAPTPQDTENPTVAFTAPASGATVAGTITLSANASDNVAVTSVAFSVDGAAISSDTTAPYSATLATTALTEGAHTLSARAMDAAGNSASTTRSITVRNTTSTPDTFSGTLDPINKVRLHNVSVSGPGTITAVANFTGANYVRVRIVAPDGSTLARRRTRSPITVSAYASSAGTYTIEVLRYRQDAAYTLTVTHP